MNRIFLQSINDWNGKGVLSVLGPTGSGKTASAIHWVQQRFPQNLKHPLLVSLDAVAVYKDLDIGSAKPLGSDRSLYSWAGLDLLSPAERFSATRFVDAIAEDIKRAFLEERPILLVGGSGFYERALVLGRAPGGPSSEDFQKSLEASSNEVLHERLLKHDLRWGEKIHLNDHYRITRYLDLIEVQSLSYDELKDPLHLKSPLKDLGIQEVSTLCLGLDVSRDNYAQLLAKRIEDMFEQGWLQEAQSLNNKYGISAPGLQSVGYKEICSADFKNLDLPELKKQILKQHLYLVKKQKTWCSGLLAKFSE